MTTDETATDAALASPSGFEANRATYQALFARALEQNKATLFAAMTAAGITQVIVTFDGSGDSGQIEEISALSGGTTDDLPQVQVAIASAAWGRDRITSSEMWFETAIEKLAYDLLSDNHGGWEINDGAYGEFVFDSEAGAIQLDYNERYTASEQTCHTF